MDGNWSSHTTTFMAYHRGQNSTFEFDVVVYNFYLDLQLNIQVSYFSTVLVDLTLFVSRFNFVVRSIQHSSLRNSTFNFRKYPTASQSMRVSVGSANYQNTPLVFVYPSCILICIRKLPMALVRQLTTTGSVAQRINLKDNGKMNWNPKFPFVS